MMHRPTLAVVFACALAAGCGLPKGSPAPHLYVLGASSGSHTNDGNPVTWSLSIDRPETDGGLDTRHIAVRPSRHRLAYYSRSQWTEPAPDMLRRLISDEFHDSGRVVNLDGSGSGGDVDFVLELDLREFQAVVPRSGGAPEVRVSFVATVMRDSTGATIGQLRISARRISATTRVEDVVDAFDAATSEAIGKLMRWTIKTANAAPSSK